MPNQPYGPDRNAMEIPLESGAAVLIELGQLLCDLEFAASRSLRGTDAADLRERVGRKQQEVDGFFNDRPRAGMRKFVTARTGNKVDPRACRLVGYLAARAVMHGMDAVGIMEAARAVSLKGEPAEILESRRFIAAMGTHGIVECSGRADGLWHPSVRLAGDVMVILLGGGRCIPLVNSESLAEVADDRRRRLAHSVNKPRPRRRAGSTRTGVAAFVESVPVATPREICKGLDACGYVGQEPARRAVALAAYRHVERLRQIHLRGVPRDELPPVGNLCCIGPTGCGKSFLMRLMFEGALMIPTAVLDVTAYSETGYVGQEVGSMPTHLLLAADGDVEKAQCGVVVLDEFDKLAEDGSGTATRVSRHGVQRGLLKLLDPGSVETPRDLNGYHFKRRMIPFRTDDILWVACGAFSGLEASGVTGRIGFSDAPCRDTGGRDAGLTGSVFEKYGLLPELVGRFHQWVRFDGLSRDQLREILVRNSVEQRRRELKAHGVKLEVEDAAIELIVARAMERGTGARGIEAELAGALEDASFEAYSDGKAEAILVHVAGGEIAWDVSFRRKGKPGGTLTAEDLADMAEGLSLDAG